MPKELKNIFEQAKNQKPLIPFNEEQISGAMKNAQNRKLPSLRFNKMGFPKQNISIFKIFSIMTGIAIITSIILLGLPSIKSDNKQIPSQDQLEIHTTSPIKESNSTIEFKSDQETVLKTDINSKKSTIYKLQNNAVNSLAPKLNKPSKTAEKNRLTFKVPEIAILEKYESYSFIQKAPLDSVTISKIPFLNTSQIAALGFNLYQNGEIYINQDSSGYFRYITSRPKRYSGYKNKYPDILLDSLPPTSHNNFIPVFISTVESGSVIAYPNMMKDIDKMVVSPVIFPKNSTHLYFENRDIVVWFTFDETFWEIIENSESKSLNTVRIDHELKLRQEPKSFAEKYIESLNLVELDSSGYIKLGFEYNFRNDTVFWNYNTGNYSYSYEYVKLSNQGKRSNSREISLRFGDYKKKKANWPLYICNTKGRPLQKSLDLESTESYFSYQIENKVKDLIPVLISIDKMYSNKKAILNDYIFWFEPSEELFSRLPDSIANEMREEYHSNVLKLKGEKQEEITCKYFQSYCSSIPGVGDISLYPNPTKQVINITIPHTESQILHYDVVDLSGKQLGIAGKTSLFEQGEKRMTLNVSKLTPGMYLIVFRSAQGETQGLRFIKK